MADYVVEVTTLPLTAGNKHLVEGYAVTAANLAAAIVAVKAATQSTPDQIVNPVARLRECAGGRNP